MLGHSGPLGEGLALKTKTCLGGWMKWVKGFSCMVTFDNQTYCGDHLLLVYTKIELCRTLETNMLYTNFT